MKYFIYARKFADSEERQILSIASQLQELRDFGKRENLELVAEFTESKTAKEPDGTLMWQMKMRKELGLESTLGPRGRPKKN